jgi:hypothetical protein
MKKINFSSLTQNLVVTLFLSGVVTMLAGFSLRLHPLLSYMLVLPLLFLFLLCVKLILFFKEKNTSNAERFLLVILGGIWLLHATGVFVPETGFDAVWYHLPIIKIFVDFGKVFYIPYYYQSANPMFSDLIFLLGFQTLKDLGAKLIAFLFGITCVLVSYQLARQFFNRFWSLVTVIIISSFQVLAWQSSSFYIDVAKAMWEVSACWMLFKYQQQPTPRNLLWTGLFFGASLATKLFSLFVFPAYLIGIFLFRRYGSEKKGKPSLPVISFIAFVLISLIVVLPFYITTYRTTGTPFYSFTVHTQKLEEIGGEKSPVKYLLKRSLLLPSSLTELSLFNKDYTTLIFLVFFPLLLIYRRQIWQDKKLRFLFLFSLLQWFIWWYLPPLSSRYALSGFITLTILYLWCIDRYIKEKPAAKNYIYLAIAISVLINIVPRIVVTERNLKYILHFQTKKEYIHQFYDGSIDVNLQMWYGMQK